MSFGPAAAAAAAAAALFSSAIVISSAFSLTFSSAAVKSLFDSSLTFLFFKKERRICIKMVELDMNGIEFYFLLVRVKKMGCYCWDDRAGTLERSVVVPC